MALALTAVAALAGCAGEDAGSADEAQVNVSIKASVCTDSTKTKCYSLGVPKAKVELRAADGDVEATAETDDNGGATLSAPASLPAGEIVVLSDLLEGGQAKAAFTFSGKNPSSVALMGKLKAGATS